MLIQLFIPGIYIPLGYGIVYFFVCCQVRFASIFLIFAPIFIRDIDQQFYFLVMSLFGSGIKVTQSSFIRNSLGSVVYFSIFGRLCKKLG